MAGRGPAPQEVRRRRNEPARGEWSDLAPLEKRVLPKHLPTAPPLIIRHKDGPSELLEGHWSERTLAAWEAWARDPATGQYGPAEVAAAVELAYVMEDFVRAGTRGANEVRLRMDGLGLTPKGKRDLRWRASTEPPEDVRPTRSRTPSSKRRSRLSVVK